MKPLQITPGDAKSIVLRSQLLEGKQKGKSKSATLEIIKRLGYLQIDTISVVERSHHHILWTRQPGYIANHLNQLQEHDQEIFEYWGHAAAYLPMEDFRFYQYKMKQFLNTKGQWFKNSLELCKTLMPSILKRIENEGELSSKDFKSTPSKENTGWWNWKPSKIALELLFWQGKLMISKRKGFQKVYDLPQRVVPNHINQKEPTNEEVCDYQIKKSLRALGLASEKDIQYILRIAGKKDISAYLKKLIENKQLSQIQVGKLPAPYFALPELINRYAESSLKNNKIHILSPFDNLIINRDRLRELFAFNYTIECYVPAPKRKYGYFCLPLLWKGTFIGQIDIKADRKQKTLLIQQMHFGKKIKLSNELSSKLAIKLLEFKTFNQCDKISFSNKCSVSEIKSLQNSLNKK